MAKKKVAIIGAGVAGLAASVRCAKLGYDVHVFESNDFYGGKINSKYYGEYRFDRGPSVFTGPEYMQELFEFAGEDFSQFRMAPLEHSFFYFFNDGMRIQLSNDREEIIDTLAEALSEDRSKIDAYMKKSGENYKTIAPLFIEQSLHKWRKVIGPRLFRALGRLPKYRLNKTMHEENKKWFKNPRTVQVFDRFSTYNGSSPYKAPAMLNMISHLEINKTPFLPEQGMIQITRSMFELAEKLGVQFHFNELVEEILMKDGQCAGIRTSSGTHDTDIVFSNMDVSYTYERLLPKEKHPQKILDQERSSSAVVFYWGIKKEFPELSLHNIFFSDDYPEEFKAIFKTKTLIDDPTIYINITSKHVKGDAPEGCENWFVMVNAPTIEGQDWDAEVKRLRKNLIEKISKVLGEDIEPLIEVEDVMDPVTIENRYSGKQGAIYGNASNNRFAAFYRHANFSKEINNLFFVGVSVHPGGGIPLALNSAKIAVDSMRERGL